MRYIETLIEQGYDISKLPKDIKKGVYMILKATDTNSKIEALDLITLNSIRSSQPIDNRVEALYEISQADMPVKNNNGFNSALELEIANKEFTPQPEKMATGKLINKIMDKPEFSPEAIKIVPKHQLKFLKSIDFSEQEDATENVNNAVSSVPKLYGQDGVPDKMIYLHYFYGNQDWYVTEYDKASGEFFGYVDLGYGAEMGYMSVAEIINNGKVELDFYFTPTLWSEIDSDKESSFDKQNNTGSYEDESEIDFYFSPPNDKGRILANSLSLRFDKVTPDETSSNTLKLEKKYSGIKFVFEAFDNTTEFKFTCLKPDDYFVSLNPVPTTQNGKLLDLELISLGIWNELQDAMDEYVAYAENNKKFANNSPVDYSNDIVELTNQLVKIDYAGTGGNDSYNFYNEVAKRYYNGDERIKTVVDEALNSQYKTPTGNVQTKENENKIPVALISLQIRSNKTEPAFTFNNYNEANSKMRELLDNESFSDLNYTIEWRDGKVYQGVIDCEPRSFFKNKKQPFTEHINYFFKQIAEYVGDALVNPADQFFFQTLIKNYQLLPDDKVMQSVTSFDVTSYKNPYELNKAIEKWIDDNVGSFDNVMNRTYSTAEKMFIRNYTGYGGLGKFGTLTVGSMFEFFTPHKVIKSMWALAYKYGYSIEKSILETSVGTGEFLQYASPQTRKLAYEINRYSATITKILYPTTEVRLAPFESMFIKDNYTIKGKTDNLEKFDMVIGNCPYGSFDVLDDKASRYLLGMGEKDFTKAGNYIEYFLRRSLDCLKPNGLIVMIVGAELKNGGSMFLDAKESPVKEYMNEHAILLDAYRLPDSTFERTGVTSDILVIQKK
jgi:hypothetical protein